MSRIQYPTDLCCLLDPHGICSACHLKLCDECFPEHLQKNDCEVKLQFTDRKSDETYAYFTSMKCSILGRPAIYLNLDTTINF